MKASVISTNLAPALAIVSRAISRRTSLPILQNVRLSTDDGGLRLEATDLEIFLRTWVSAKVDEDGAITVAADDLLQIAKMASRGEGRRLDLSIDTQKARLVIEQGPTTRTLTTLPADEMPVFNMPEAKDIRVKASFAESELHRALSQSLFAAASDQARPILQGVSLKLGGPAMELAACDNYRVVTVQVPWLDAGTTEREAFVVPATALAELLRLISPKSEEPVVASFVPSKAQVLFETANGVLLLSRMIDGTYPNYQSVIPRKATLAGGATVSRVAIVGLLAETKNLDTNTLNLSFSPDSIKVEAHDYERTFETTIPARYDGESAHVALDSRWLDGLTHLPDPEIVLWPSRSPLAPVVIEAAGRDDYQYVVMPVRTAS